MRSAVQPFQIRPRSHREWQRQATPKTKEGTIVLYHRSVQLPESHKYKRPMPGSELLRPHAFGVIARRGGRSACLIVLTSLLCASLCVLADETGSDDLRKASAQVTAIEPFTAPIFVHTPGASLSEHGARGKLRSDTKCLRRRAGAQNLARISSKPFHSHPIASKENRLEWR